MNHAREFFWKALQRTGLVKRRKHHFQVTIDSFKERLNTFPGKPRQESSGGGGVGVLILPWLQTAVPLYSLECARQFAARGEKVTLIWDETSLFNSASNAWEVSLLEDLVLRLRDEFAVVEPSNEVPSWEKEPAFFEELLTENAVQACRGEGGVQAWLAERPELRAQLRAHVERVADLFRRHRFDWLFVPGGVWAISGVYNAVAQEQGLRTVTFDSGPGSLFIASNGIAAHFPDVTATAQTVIESTETDGNLPAHVEIEAREKLDERMRGDDEYRLQPIAASASPGGKGWDILVPLNLRWDSAALCRRRLFSSVEDWLSQLLAWLEKHPDVTLAIRQHPCEKLPAFRGTDDFRELLTRFPQLGQRATFISAEEQVNTYDLIHAAKVVLPFTSRVGIEATMLGRPVILGTECYYKDCGFTWNPASALEYFAALSEALAGNLKVTEDSRRRACITYYLAECCLELRTRFTPAPVDYSQWVKMSPAEIWASPENEDLLTALIDHDPLVAIRYRRLAMSNAANGTGQRHGSRTVLEQTQI
ncbi:MAG TPA: hypothetical protein VGM54_26625 [Chthoniobacter sp.]|jgi:hypothetical protein